MSTSRWRSPHDESPPDPCHCGVDPDAAAQQVHVFETGSAEIERHIAFRDFMRVHAKLAKRYSDLKRRLAAEDPRDIEAYMDGKDAFVDEMEQLALAWRRHA